ncbi:MAG: MBL fold metallo-hydrolase RNA specificity domain-containing protein [Euryarchaeota archaeon]|nr:MBL fold metallo-hydrolase RNA specificity domain-containing protein [Euryarchaeota archaeon]
MKIQILGGKNEIGGNKIILSHKDTQVLLDFGMSFSQNAWYFSEFLQPRKGASLRDFFEFDLLPDISGVYREDYLKHMGRDPAERTVDALFLSHAHMDHAAYIHFLRKDIPIYCSEPTKILLRCIEETGSGSFTDFYTYSDSFKFYENRRGKLSRVTRRKKEYVTEREYHTEKKVKVGSMEVERVPVDHSLPGACGYIIHTDEETVLYSGDLRFHGHHGEKTKHFVEKAKEAEPDIFLCEGTRIDKKERDSEKKVRDTISGMIAKNDGIAFVEHPKKDTDRVKTVYDAAKKNERELVIDLKLAYLTERLGDRAPFEIKDIRILVPKKSWGLIEKEDVPEYQVLRDYRRWERDFLSRENILTCSELRENQESYVVSTSFWEINQLVDIQPKGALWIKSSCEPFSDEMELDEGRKQHWLEHFGIQERTAHASGHASGPEIREMIKEIKSKKVIPIHTEHPELF